MLGASPAATHPEASATTQPSPTPSTASTATSVPEDANVSTGWRWFVIAVLIAAAVGYLLLRRMRRRRSWDSQLTAAEEEAGGFVRELIPQLSATESTAGVAGGWAVAAARVAALHDQLSTLAGTAPDDPRRASAESLRDAIGSPHGTS